MFPIAPKGTGINYKSGGAIASHSGSCKAFGQLECLTQSRREGWTNAGLHPYYWPASHKYSQINTHALQVPNTTWSTWGNRNLCLAHKLLYPYIGKPLIHPSFIHPHTASQLPACTQQPCSTYEPVIVGISSTGSIQPIQMIDLLSNGDHTAHWGNNDPGGLQAT